MVVEVDLRRVFAIVDAVRDEGETTGFLVRRHLALALGLRKPSDDEIDAYVRAHMVWRGAKDVPARPIRQWKGAADIDACWWWWAKRFVEPIWEFVDDPALWVPERSNERLP